MLIHLESFHKEAMEDERKKSNRARYFRLGDCLVDTFNSLNSPNFKLLNNENVPDLTLLLIIWQLIHQGKNKNAKKNKDKFIHEQNFSKFTTFLVKCAVGVIRSTPFKIALFILCFV